MRVRAGLRFFSFSLISVLAISAPLGICAAAGAAQAVAQTAPAQADNRDAELQLVVMLSRHGVRSPIGDPNPYAQYAAAPWAKWDVPQSYLTAHGYELMKLFGAWDRTKFSGEGLLAPTGCGEQEHVSIIADTDQRTRLTGKALAEGMLPGCSVPVSSAPDGTNDPLFRPIESGAVHPDRALVAAAVAGRVGGDPNHLTEVYRPQLTILDRILAGCGHLPANPKRVSVFDIPAGITPGAGGSPVAFRGPVASGATMAENLLLEYTDGMSNSDVGWGCVDGATLRTVMQINTAGWEYADRTPIMARTYASGILDRILKTMAQSATGQPVAGALGKPGDRLVILVGHDTNIATVAGALDIGWALDGRVDDTPPGGALLFELWRPRAGGEPFVRMEFVTQTLEQMRNSEVLTPANPPAEAPIFVPGCGRADLTCSWEGFSAAMRNAIDPAYVGAQP